VQIYELIPPLWLYIAPVDPGGIRPADIRLPLSVKTLRDFAEFWDYNDSSIFGRGEHIALVPEIDDRHLRWLGDRQPTTLRLLPSTTVTARSPAPLRLAAQVSQDRLAIFGDDPAGAHLVRIDLDLIKSSATLQDLIANSLNKKWRSGLFNRTFPELTRLTASERESQIDQMAIELTAEVGDKPERIEVLGAKLPPESLTKAGFILVLGAQLYLWIHLDALRSLAIGKCRIVGFEWIGLSNQISIVVFTVATIVILPIMAAGVLFSRFWRDSGDFPLIALPFFLASVGLGLCTFRAWRDHADRKW